MYLLSEQNFWRSVPHGDDFVRVGPHRVAEGSSEAKVGEFDDSLLVNQQVLWFQISMNYSPLVTKIQRLYRWVTKISASKRTFS